MLALLLTKSHIKNHIKSRKLHMTLLGSVLLASSVVVQAESLQVETFKPDYVGVSYLSVKSDERSADFNADLIALGLTGSVTQTDLSRSGWSPYIGYQIDDIMAIELGYVDLGNVTTRINGTAVNINTYLNTASAVHPTTASGWTLNFVIHRALHERLDVFVKFGALVWEADYTLASATASKTFSDDGIDSNFAIGLEMDAMPHLRVRFGWNQYRFAETNVNAWELGLGYHF